MGNTSRGSNAANNANKSSSKSQQTPFTQRFNIVEGSSIGTSNSEAARFRENSDQMAARAVQDTRDTLLWVNRFGDGPADRAQLRQAALTMKPNQYRDLMTERWVNGSCSYPACGNPPRREYNSDKPVYRIQLRSRKVTDESATSKFCSDECARRSAWYEGVCLNQHGSWSSSSIGHSAEPIQLLEDVEEQQRAANSNGSSVATNTMSGVPQANVPTADAAFTGEAESFLARLAIIERTPTTAPAPPTLSSSIASPDDRLPSAAIAARSQARGGAGSALLPFDVTTVQRELIASQQGIREAGLHAQGPEDPAQQRRVEIDVDPENRDTLEAGWELFKQLRENGDMS